MQLCMPITVRRGIWQKLFSSVRLADVPRVTVQSWCPDTAYGFYCILHRVVKDQSNTECSGVVVFRSPSCRTIRRSRRASKNDGRSLITVKNWRVRSARGEDACPALVSRINHGRVALCTKRRVADRSVRGEQLPAIRRSTFRPTV